MMTHIIDVLFDLVIRWRMQGWLKGQSHILKIAITISRKRMLRVHFDREGDGWSPAPADP